MASNQGRSTPQGSKQEDDRRLGLLRRLSARYSKTEQKFGLLTAKKAFHRWLIHTKPYFAGRLMATMFKNSRVTPSKAMWTLLAKARPSRGEFAGLDQTKRLEIGLTIISSLMKKVQYRNQHHYFFQGRLLFLKLPLVFSLVKRFRTAAQSAFRTFRLALVTDKLGKLALATAFLERSQRNPLIDAIWKIRMEALAKRKSRVHFRIDSFDSASLKSCPVKSIKKARLQLKTSDRLIAVKGNATVREFW